MAGGTLRTAARHDGSGADALPLTWLRVSMVLLALLTSAAHLFALPGQTPQVTFWLETEVVGFLLVAVIYLLGLRSWYPYTIAYAVLNLLLFFLSAVWTLPGITAAPLVGHLQFAHYSYGRFFSLVGWLYLIGVGSLLEHYDPGSGLDWLIRQARPVPLPPQPAPTRSAHPQAPPAAAAAAAAIGPETIAPSARWASLVGIGTLLLVVGFALLFSLVASPLGALLIAVGIVALAVGIVMLGVDAWHAGARRTHR